ncbi:MAG: hypothetical protein Q8K62_12415 [Thiobacillus sp.]|nr:hypothetical protein [Thiobacillus sp.]
MKRWRQILLAWVLAPTLQAATPCPTGGTPSQRDGSGQGGTRLHPADGDGSGSGGTGLTVDVEGVISGFASICVNRLELRDAPATSVTRQKGPIQRAGPDEKAAKPKPENHPDAECKTR